MGDLVVAQFLRVTMHPAGRFGQAIIQLASRGSVIHFCRVQMRRAQFGLFPNESLKTFRQANTC